MTTPIYEMDEWEEGQANPHITVNTMMRILEAMSSRILADLYSSSPPSPSADGAVFYIDGVGSGEWLGHEGEIAISIAGGWHFITPKIGWVFYSEVDGYNVQYVGSSPGDASAWMTIG